MAKGAKKRKSEAENKAQFNRTVKNTGKWRGKTPEKYIKYKRVKHRIE